MKKEKKSVGCKTMTKYVEHPRANRVGLSASSLFHSSQSGQTSHITYRDLLDREHVQSYNPSCSYI